MGGIRTQMGVNGPPQGCTRKTQLIVAFGGLTKKYSQNENELRRNNEKATKRCPVQGHANVIFILLATVSYLKGPPFVFGHACV